MSIAAKCTCGCSLTGVCTSSVEECNQLINMENNTQLPIEVVDKIEQEAHDATCALYSPNNYDEFTSFRSGWEKGATAYASKLHQVEQENADLKKQLDQWQVDFRRVQYEAINYANRKEEIEKQRDEALAEVSSLKAQRGPGWVKASERLPKPFIAKFVRIEGIMSIAAWHKDHERFVDDAGDFHPADQVEWLDEQPAALKPTYWDVAKAFKWAAEYNNELGENLVLTEDGQWLLMKREGGITETEELTPGNVAELYCLQNGFTKEKAEQPAAGREGDAVEFAEWAGWDWRRVEGKSMWENQKTLEVLKTQDLYERYEKATGKKD